MGEKILRPLHEGVGLKPSTPKPGMPELIKAHQGERPSTPKPQPSQPVAQGGTQAKET
jgi:hypothetical protein